MTTGVHTCLAYDLRTMTLKEEIPLVAATYGTKLNGIGSTSGNIGPIADNGLTARNLAAVLEPERTALFWDRDGVLTWGGILWRWDYQSKTDIIKLQGQTFESYFRARLLRMAKNYAPYDLLQLVEDLVNYVQAVAGGNIGVVVPTTAAGVNVNLTFTAQERRIVYDIIDQLSKQSVGFDWAVDVQYSSTKVPVLTLALGYPRRGRSSGQGQQGGAGLVWEFPGNITEFAWSKDGTRMATTVDVIGPNNGPQTVIASSAAQAPVDAGYPVIDAAFPAKDIADSTVLARQAAAYVQQLAWPLEIPVVTVDPGLVPQLGAYLAGDEGTFRFTAPIFGTAVKEVLRRITAIDVTPGDQTQKEKAALTLGPTLP